MAQTNNQDFYLMALKALKLMGEKSPVGSDERKLYSTKADSLRNVLKTQFGMTNIDADYGPGVALKDTPGGGNIDWNVLSNAADVLGTSQAGSTRSAFDRALGEYLTRNLPAWQKSGAQSPSSSITNTTVGTLGGTGAAQNIIAGQPLPSGQPVSSVNSGMQASQAVATQQAKAAGTWNMGTAGGIEPPATTNTPPTGTDGGTGSGAGVYGDFIKSEYFKNNDYEGYFISKTPNVPTIQGNDGKLHIDWSNPNMPANMYTLYGNGVGFWNTAQGLSAEKANLMDISAIEKNPAFIEQSKVFTAEMDMLLKQNGLAVDAQLRGLEGSIAANKAGLEYELNTIKREISSSNWRSRQSLAASGMAFSGMLGYLYGQNEAKGTDAAIRATAVSAAEIKSMGEQMAILEGSKLSYASDLEGLYGAKRAAYRASLLDPQNARYTEVGKLLDEAIAGMEGTTAVAPASLAMGQRQAAGEAAKANYDTAIELAKLDKAGIWLQQTPDGNWTWKTGLTDAEQTARDSALFDQWYKTGGLNLDWANLDLNKDKLVLDQAKQKFSEWATEQGLSLDSAKLDLEWAKLAETVRSNKAGQTGAGATNPDGTPAYDPAGDYTTLRTSNVPPAALGLAKVRLMAGLGAVNDSSLDAFLNGTTLYFDPKKGTWETSPPEGVDNPQTSPGTPGFLALTEDKAIEVLSLIKDPVMQIKVAVSYEIQGSPDYISAVDAYTSHLTEVDLTNEQKDALAKWIVGTFPLRGTTAGGTIWRFNTKKHQFEQGNP